MKITLMIAALLVSGMVSAQVNLGVIKGKIIDDESKTTIPSAKVWIEGKGNTNRMLANIDGKFKFEALTPGIYILYTCATGKDTTIMNSVEV